MRAENPYQRQKKKEKKRKWKDEIKQAQGTTELKSICHINQRDLLSCNRRQKQVGGLKVKKLR